MSKPNINNIFANITNKHSKTVESLGITEEEVFCYEEWEYTPVVHDENTKYGMAPTVTGKGLGFSIRSCPTPSAASRRTRGGNAYSYRW